MKITDNSEYLGSTNCVPRTDFRTLQIHYGMETQQQPHFKDEQTEASRS